MPTYQIQVARENKDVQREYPNLTAPVLYPVTVFTHPRDLRGVSKDERRDIITAQLKHMSADDVQADITLDETEQVSLYLFRAEENPQIPVGELEIPNTVREAEAEL